MSEAKIQVIFHNNKPHGIRDSGGFLLFFSNITKYPGQEERYRREIEEQFALSDYLKKCLEDL